MQTVFLRLVVLAVGRLFAAAVFLTCKFASMSAEHALTRPTFTSSVSNENKETRMKRLTCLNFKSKIYMKRNAALELIKKLNFPLTKMIGIAEMRYNSIDVTCKTREDILTLYRHLQKVNKISNVKLYEQEYVHVIVGWVPISMSNSRIQEAIEKTIWQGIKCFAAKK